MFLFCSLVSNDILISIIESLLKDDRFYTKYRSDIVSKRCDKWNANNLIQLRTFDRLVEDYPLLLSGIEIDNNGQYFVSDLSVANKIKSTYAPNFNIEMTEHFLTLPRYFSAIKEIEKYFDEC
jgi:hypothetical protein